jgi:hypothetical protein
VPAADETAATGARPLGLGRVGQILAWLASDGRLDIDHITAIVNAPSNFLLTRLAEPGATLASALQDAERAGCAADPSHDLDGHDAAEKLTLLAALLGWSALPRHQVEVDGIRALTADDLAAARAIGGAIKPVVWAARGPLGVEAFVGPAFLSSREPLGTVNGAQNGIRLDGKDIPNLFFSGPDTGLNSSARTLLYDPPPRNPRGPKLRAPITSWFVRITFPGVVPTDETVKALVSAVGLDVEHVIPGSTGRSRWVTSRPRSRRDIEAASARLRAIHRIATYAIRLLG